MASSATIKSTMDFKPGAPERWYYTSVNIITRLYMFCSVHWKIIMSQLSKETYPNNSEYWKQFVTMLLRVCFSFYIFLIPIPPNGYPHINNTRDTSSIIPMASYQYCRWRHIDITKAQWASYQIRKIVCCACAGIAGNVFPATSFKGKRKLVIPACITARASRTCRDACRDLYSVGAGKTFPAFPAHAQPAILRIWQEAHKQHLPHSMSIYKPHQAVHSSHQEHLGNRIHPPER